MSRPFLTAEWRNLVMVNYEIDPAALRPLIPAGTELDLWQGRCLVSLVGFQFRKTRVLGLPVPWHINFDEINLRFYVRRQMEEDWRRGVVFVREIVSLPAISLVANWVYHENYVTHAMRSRIALPGELSYSWMAQGTLHTMSAFVAGNPQPLQAGSMEEFVTEHYWGYVRRRDRQTAEYQVQHPSWRIWPTLSAEISDNVRSYYGEPFADALSRSPHSFLVAEGSPIAVYAGQKLSR